MCAVEYVDGARALPCLLATFVVTVLEDVQFSWLMLRQEGRAEARLSHQMPCHALHDHPSSLSDGACVAEASSLAAYCSS